MQAETFKLDKELPLQFKVVSAVQVETFKLDKELPLQFKVVSAVQVETFKLVKSLLQSKLVSDTKASIPVKLEIFIKLLLYSLFLVTISLSC